MSETPHTVLANDKFRHLLDDVGTAGHLWAGRIHFYHINKKYDSGLKGLIKMSYLVMRRTTSRSPNAVHTALLEGKLRHDLLKELAILFDWESAIALSSFAPANTRRRNASTWPSLVASIIRENPFSSCLSISTFISSTSSAPMSPQATTNIIGENDESLDLGTTPDKMVSRTAPLRPRLALWIGSNFRPRPASGASGIGNFKSVLVLIAFPFLGMT